MKKNNNLEEAKECLKRAKDLNPNHLPIFNELGRVYTFLGNYEDADAEFKNALVEEKHPNYRHKIITYQFSADNYKRWAESFGHRRDKDGQKNMLEKALSEIKKAKEIKGNDQKILNLYRSVCKELGVYYLRCKLVSEGKPYLEESMKTIKVGTQSFYPEPETVAESCYYFAYFLMNDIEKENNRNLIRKYIKNGIMHCSPGSKWHSKLLEIDSILDGNVGSKDRFLGTIKFFNFSKKYGVIEYGNEETIIFLIEGFGNNIKIEEMDNIDGMSVSFNIQKSRNPKNKYVAVNIEQDGEQ